MTGIQTAITMYTLVMASLMITGAGLRSALAVLALLSLLALLFTRGIPTVQPGAQAKVNAPPIEAPVAA